MMSQVTFHVQAEWDHESKYWVAQSDDLPNLVTGALTKDDLKDKVTKLIPACLAVSRKVTDPDLSFDVEFAWKT